VTVRVGAVSVVVAAVAFAAAGCGGTSRTSGTTTAARHVSPSITSKHCRGLEPAQLRKRRLLERDLAAMRVAAKPLEHLTLMGSPAMQRTTGTFVDDLDRSGLPNYVKSHYSALAGAIVAGVCDQCFQMIEADRPVAGGAKLRESC
jgi:hypothetical protein